MDEEHLQLLKSSIDRCVVLRCVDGEVIVARILFVSDEEDIVYDLVSSNRLETYEQTGKTAAYLVPIIEVAAVHPWPEDPSQ